MKRLFVVLLGLMLAIPLFALPALASEEEDTMRRIGTWFKIYDDALDHWTVSLPDVNDDQRVLMSRKVAAPGPKRTVMVIYPRKSSAYDVAMTVMLADFATKPLNLDFLAVNFGKDPARGAKLVEEARAKGHALIYAMGSETVEWMHKSHRDITTPVVTVCAKDPVQLGQMPDYERGSGTAYAFTSLNVLLDVQVEYLRELKPNLKNLAILVDTRNASAVETQARPIAEAVRKLGIDAFDVAVTEPAQAAAQLETLVPQAVARMRRNDPELKDSAFWITGSTSVFVEIATITKHADKVPVLAVVPEVVQAGRDSAVLSIGVSFESNAQLAAVYGAEILTGRAKAGQMKVGVVSPPDIAVNFLRAREIGLKIPFSFFEAATFVYDGEGKAVRVRGQDAKDLPGAS